MGQRSATKNPRGDNYDDIGFVSSGSWRRWFMNILWDVNERERASCVRRTTSRYRCYECSSTNFSMPFKGSRPDVERRYKLFAPSSSSAPVECIAPAAPLLLPSEKTARYVIPTTEWIIEPMETISSLFLRPRDPTTRFRIAVRDQRRCFLLRFYLLRI